MQFQPFLNQLTPDSTFDWKLPKALTLAAFGLSDSQLSRYRAQLSEGIHWFKDRHAGNKIWFTLTGLLELSALLNPIAPVTSALPCWFSPAALPP